MKSTLIILSTCALICFPLHGQFSSDVIKTSEGDLELFFVGHGTLMFKFDHKVIHIDPTMREADYATMPDAAKAFRPDILYPYHYGDTDPQELVELLKKEKDIEVRIRDLK